MKIIKQVWTFLLDMAEAKYAADLARNGKIEEAQAIYKKS
jgi:hypothetical protein